MSLLKPEITVTLFPGRKKKQQATTEEVPTVDYIAASKEAALDLGKKFFVGLAAVSVTTVAAATVGAIAVVATHHALNK